MDLSNTVTQSGRTAATTPPSLDQLADILKPGSNADVLALAVVTLVFVVYLLRGRLWDKPDPYLHIWYERPQAVDGAQGLGNAKSRNAAERLEELSKDVAVFWGSQSGTAEAFANRLSRELRQRLGLDAMAADLSDFEPETMAQIPPSKTAIFILSTYGEGDPSDNATQFWEWLTKVGKAGTEVGPLSSLRYAAFGLGNSDYQYYNRVVDVVDGYLGSYGAQRLMATGKADDSQGATEEDFLSWKDKLFAFLGQHFGIEEHEPKYEPTVSVVEDDSLQEADIFDGEPAHPPEGSTKESNSPIKALKIRNARELFTTPDRNCLHLDLDLTGHAQLSYKTGDHLAIWPMNPDQEVDRLVRVLGISNRRTTPLIIRALDPAVKVKVPTPTNIDSLFRYYLEICAPLPRDIVRGLAEFAPSSAAKNFLLNLGKDKDTFAGFLQRTHINLGRLLELAGQSGEDESGGSAVWDKLPLSYLVDALPRTQPRFYSISSSSIISPRSPSVTALVSNTPLSSAASIPGLTTNYLLALSNSMQGTTPSAVASTYNLAGPSQALEGGLVYGHIRRSKFKLPMQASCPLVLVAAGTGLAPFRAFIAERSRLQTVGKASGKILLFFGCRNPTQDFIYREELGQFQKDLGDKLEVVTAFSRLQGTKKTYVQDLVQSRGNEVTGMLQDASASLYICGRASMAREVGNVLGEAMKERAAWTDAQAKDWREGMKRTRKWQEDVWG